MTTRSTSPCQAAPTTTATYSDLDKIFTPPAACLDPTFTLSPQGYDLTGSWMTIGTTTSSRVVITTAYGLFPLVTRGRNPSCFPTNFPLSSCEYTTTIGTETLRALSEQTYLYSPRRCPEHYVIASSSVDTSATGITRAVCCPM